MRSLLTFTLTLIVFQGLMAQAPKEKWGKPTKEELTMTTCNIDPTADAAVLNNYGHYYFDRHYYYSAQELRTIYHYQVRTKIFTEAGKKYATISIPYKGYDEYENVVEISGATYTYEDGKVTKTKMKQKNIQWTRNGRNMWNCTFTLPNVKPGSVIEYSYKIASLDLAKLRDWMFQRDIPVLHSDLTLTSPYFFNFAFFSNIPEAKLSVKRTEMSQYIQFYRPSIYFNCIKTEFSARDIPTFRKEIFMPDSNRSILKGEFLLASAVTRPIEFVRYADYYVVSFLKPLLITTTENLYETKERISLFNSILTGFRITEGMEWKDFTKKLSKDPDFGKNMLKAFEENKNLIDSFRRVPAGLKRMVSIYDYIRKNIRWNGEYRILASNSMEKIFEKKVGYSSDVNMLLINTLNRAGVQARPVLISTKSYGDVYKELGFLRKFNHLIVSVELEGKRYLLDATDPNRPYDILSLDDLNGEGLLINLLDSGWIPISSIANTELNQTEKYTIGQNGQYEGEVVTSFTGQLALQKLKEENIKDHDNLSVSIRKTTQGSFISAGDSLLFAPFKENSVIDNPFTEEQRFHPVDLKFERSITREIAINIPEGYKLTSIPGNRAFAMQGDFATCSINSEQNANILKISFRLELKNAYIPPQFYPDFKLFVETVKALESEKIVLRKS